LHQHHHHHVCNMWLVKNISYLKITMLRAVNQITMFIQTAAQQ
jgi:hypothetical protein